MRWPLIIAGIWCAVLVFVVFREYAVYQAARWAICAAGIYGAITLKSGWRWSLAVVAVVFNPIAPFYLGREAWKVVDAAASAVFFISTFIKK